MIDDEGQAELRFDASAPLVMDWQRGSVPLGGNGCSVVSKETVSLEFRQPGEQILRVTAEGEFIWHKDAESMIKNGDFSNSPSLRFILQRLWSFDNKEGT